MADARRRRPWRTRRRARWHGHRARAPGGVGGCARRQAEGVLSRSQSLGERRRRRRTRSAITTDGSEKDRIKYGTASWVYGEELAQTTAMWWSPDSRKIAYYRFDEKQVPDYYLQLDQTKVQSTNDVEAYPKAGRANPVVDLFVYDVASEEDARGSTCATASRSTTASSATTSIACRGRPTARELLFNRTNRRQNILEFVAANPDDGRDPRHRARGVADRLGRQPPADAVPEGRQALHLGVRAQRLREPLSLRSRRQAASRRSRRTRRSKSPGSSKVDEAAGVLFYTARDGDNHLKLQLHRVGLDGKGDERLTDPAFHHTVGSCMRRGRAEAGDAAAFGGSGAPAGFRRTASSSSTSTRRTTRRRRRASSMRQRHGRGRARRRAT